MADVMSAPNGLRVDAAGRVTYDFDGHVHAQGLDLDAVAPNVYDPDHMLRWLRPADLYELVRAYGWDVGGGGEFGVVVQSDGGDEARVFIDAAGGVASVNAKAGAWGARIIDDQRRSQFMQVQGTDVAGNQGLRISREFDLAVGPVAPGANQNLTQGLGLVPDLGDYRAVVGHLENPSLDYIDRTTWAVVDWPADNSVHFSFYNQSDSPGDAYGTFRFRVITGD